MKLLYELAQEYASTLRKIYFLETFRHTVHINVGGLENWVNTAIEVREILDPHLPGAIDTVLKRAKESAALLKQQLDSASKEEGRLKVVK